MSRRRFFVDSIRNGTAEIEGDEARHLTAVLRVETGQCYEICDNENVYLAEVELARKQHVIFRVIEELPAGDPLPDITLIAALIKFERLETLIEKATELGVTAIRLVKAERSDKGLDIAAPKRLSRWRRIALEASQQSRRQRLPELFPPVSLRDALRLTASHRLFLDEYRTGVPIVAAMQNATSSDSTALLVGPEGGWPDHEREAARETGWTAVSLGPLVLRTETAGIAALAVVNAVLNRRK
jgi:16S rRNA (uracil1498-N3)-methyltransferase